MFKRLLLNAKRCTRLFFILLFTGCIGFVLHTLFSIYVGTRKPQEKADAAIILGAMVLPNGNLSKWLEVRTKAGLELYQQGMVNYLIVSGGKGYEGHFEGDSMRNYLVAHGVPEERIIVDNNGINTYHTAKNYLHIANEHGFKSVIAVSHYYHIARTTTLLKRLGVEDVQGYAPAISEQPDLISLPREFMAFYYYLFKYRS